MAASRARLDTEGMDKTAKPGQHTPKSGTFYNGGTFAKCDGCGQTILWAVVGDSEAAWRGDGTKAECPAAEKPAS